MSGDSSLMLKSQIDRQMVKHMCVNIG